MASGDYCLFGRNADGSSNGTAIHYDCDDFPDGTVTSIVTGKIVGRV